MDPDKKLSDDKKKTSDDNPDISDVFQSVGIRCAFCSGDEIDGILSGNRYHLLLHLNILFLLILVIIKKA